MNRSRQKIRFENTGSKNLRDYNSKNGLVTTDKEQRAYTSQLGECTKSPYILSMCVRVQACWSVISSEGPCVMGDGVLGGRVCRPHGVMGSVVGCRFLCGHDTGSHCKRLQLVSPGFLKTFWARDPLTVKIIIPLTNKAHIYFMNIILLK